MPLPAASYMNQNTRTEGEMKQALEDLLGGVKQIPGAGQAAQGLTIAAGSVTPQSGLAQVLVIDTEGAAATDDLTNIVPTNLGVNSLVLVKIASNSRQVVVKHNAGGSGQLIMRTGGDCPLADTSQWLLLYVNGSQLEEVARFPQADSVVVEKVTNYSVTLADRGKVFYVGGTNSAIFTLPQFSSTPPGFEIGIKNRTSGTVAIVGTGANVDGLASQSLVSGQGVLLLRGPSEWVIVGRDQASAGQYKFPAVHNPSTDVNTLDEYREGTWTPSLGGTATYGEQIGSYIKIGRLVVAYARMIISNIGTGSLNTITGLPYIAGANYAGSILWSNSAVNLVSLTPWTVAGSSSIRMYGMTGAGASQSVVNVFGNFTYVELTISYFANA